MLCIFCIAVLSATGISAYKKMKRPQPSDAENTSQSDLTTEPPTEPPTENSTEASTEPATEPLTQTTTEPTSVPSTAKPTEKETVHTTVAHTPGEPVIETVNGVTYVNGILIVNKTYPLPSDYNPGLNSEVKAAFNKLVAAAKSEGYSIWSVSDFRPYSSQERIYNGYLSKEGREKADMHSARPGHSEHQSGLVYDVNSLDQSFGNTHTGKWLAANCHKYGFIIRYPKGKESITGYNYEPWQIRYIGAENAKKVYDTGLCLEEYLGITSSYDNCTIHPDCGKRE